MSELDPLAFAADLVAYARRSGASQAEAMITSAERFSAEARDKNVTKLEQSKSRSVVLRTFAEGRKATLTSTDFTREGLLSLVDRTIAAAKLVAPDPFAGLPDASAAPPQSGLSDAGLQIACDDVALREPGDKLNDVRALEAQTRAFDPRITNSNGSRVSDTIARVTLVNSQGFSGSYRATSVGRGASPVAIDAGSKRTSHYGSASRGYAGLEPVDSIARTAAARLIGMFGARKPATMRVPVIFERDVAAAVLADIFHAVTGSNVAVGNSYLINRVGDRIGSDYATIIDDGRLAAGLGTGPFDSEGVPTRRTAVFERGVLKSYLFDSYYGRKLGAASTGNAAGGGIGPTNFYLEPGSGTLEDLIRQTAHGILIMNTIGFATEYASGTYSRGASGFMIENGEVTYPVEEFTVAGDFRAMLAGIDGVANDLRFDGSIVSPSLRIAEMTISGN